MTEPKKIPARAVALLSGGLDSTLAARLILEKGIKVVGLNFISPFCLCDRKKGCRGIATEVGRQLGIPVVTKSLSADYLSILRSPRHGYGKNLNPCIDCRILMLRKAREFMKQVQASFVITGEVLGQRPMSQHRRAMKLIEREAGLEGLVVRPLSGRLLPPTEPEKWGLIKREWLLDITGRSRKQQLELVQEKQIRLYACPAGGCLLSQPSFAPRVLDLLAHCESPTPLDLHLLKYGRHFRLSPKNKLIVGRSQAENSALSRLASRGDAILNSIDVPGPISVLKGSLTSKIVNIAARIHARYADHADMSPMRVAISKKGEDSFNIVESVSPADEEVVRTCLIGW